METKQLIKMLIGAVAIVTVVMIIAALIPNQAKAELDSDVRNPGKNKADTTMVEQKAIELGTAMKGWAMAFGADLKKSGELSKKAFLNDVERIKQSEFVQYQKKGFEQGKEQFARNKEQIKEMPDKIKQAVIKAGESVKNFFGGKQ